MTFSHSRPPIVAAARERGRGRFSPLARSRTLAAATNQSLLNGNSSMIDVRAELGSIALIFFLAGFVFAHDGHDHDHKPRKAEDAETYRPTVVPDRIVLTWSDDPATTQSVTWRTDATVEKAFAEIAIAEDGPKFRDSADRHSAKTVLYESNLGPAHYHSITFTGLQPKTRYAYRVGDGVNWSEWNQFLTASDTPEPFSFVYFGDAQNDVKSMWSRVVREAYRDAPKAAFLLHAGDLVNDAHSDGEWGEWFYAGGHIHRMVPCVPTPGNHEYDPIIEDGLPTIEDYLSENWRPTFTLPENGPEGLEETAYWFDYQGARIVSLNSNRKIRQQAEWLGGVLENNPQEWTIVTFHHPIYSAKPERDNPHIRAAWQPIFDKYQVDIVLQGHDHSYARTGMVSAGENVPTGVTARSEEGGTVYVVSVSGPKMYDVDPQKFMRRVGEDTQLYQIIHVDGDELRYEARTAIGRLYDAFTLRKREGQVNEIIEQVPETPERRRPPEARDR